MQIEVVHAHEVGARAAAFVAAALDGAVAARGHAKVAFSGGSGASELLGALVSTGVAWRSVHVLQVDERVAPRGHGDRNLTAIHAELLDHVDIPPANVHPMPVEDENLDGAADAYARDLAAVAGEPPTIDVAHLGIGGDGHTASLLPGSDLIEPGAPAVAATDEYQGRRRMTLTAPTLSRARSLLWIVTGAEKADVVRRFVDGDRTLPAVHIHRARAVLLLDPAAAARLT